MINKYYWYCFKYTSKDGKKYGEFDGCVGEHPFHLYEFFENQGTYSNLVLINWKEITEEEYMIFSNHFKKDK